MILLVFDSSDKTMYRSLTSKWLSLITSTVPDVFTLCGAYMQIPVIILANKIDLLTDNEGLINELTFFLTEIYNDYDVSFRSYLH